jgi:hypothetical protein
VRPDLDESLFVGGRFGRGLAFYDAIVSITGSSSIDEGVEAFGAESVTES